MQQILSARREEILRSIVGEYIVTAAPVGSVAISRRHGLQASPATVRHEMASLEEEGYITRPHPSAGGIPADKGYRYYVQGIPDAPQLSETERETLLEQFQRADRDFESLTRLAAQVLSGLVGNLAIATSPRAMKSQIRRIELIYLQNSLGLLIAVLPEARLTKEIVPLDPSMTPEELGRISAKINTYLSGLSKEQILESSIEFSEFEQKIKYAVVHILEKADHSQSEDYFVEGLRHLLAQPEFDISYRARELVEALEDRRLVQGILFETPGIGDTRVVIGDENQGGILKPFSVVVSRYGISGEITGTMAILGPTRMEYQRSIAGIGFLTSLMSQLLEGGLGVA